MAATRFADLARLSTTRTVDSLAVGIKRLAESSMNDVFMAYENVSNDGQLSSKHAE